MECFAEIVPKHPNVHICRTPGEAVSDVALRAGQALGNLGHWPDATIAAQAQTWNDIAAWVCLDEDCCPPPGD